MDSAYFEGGTIPWVKIADATKSGKYLYETKEKVNEYGASFSRLLPKGSLIVAASGTLGYTQILGVDGCIHDGWLYLTGFKNVEKDFMYYYLHSRKDHFYSIAYGAAIQNINTTVLREMEIALPPLHVQRKIGGILSAYDDLIENNLRRIKILEEMAQAIYGEWFVNFRFPGHKNGKMTDSSLGRIPERWEAVTLRDVTRYINRGISPIYDDNSDTLVLNQRCIRDGKINPDLSRKQSKQVPQEKFAQFGDVLINSTGVGTLGRVAQLYETVENCTVDSHVTIARANKRVNLDYFGFHLLGLQLRFEHSGTGTTGQTELSRETIANCDFLLPSMDLQNSFSDTVSGMRQAITIMARADSNLRATRDLLLPRLISGEVDVSKLDAEEVTAPA